MNALATLISVLLLTSITNSSPCNPISPANLLQVGSVRFPVSAPNTRRYCSTVPILFAVPSSGIQSTASIFNYGNYSLQLEVDYLLQTRQTFGEDSLTITFLISEVQPWAYILVGYLISGRPDVLLGYILIDTSATYDPTAFASGDPYSIVSNVVLPGWISGSTVQFSALLLAGLRSCSCAVVTTLCFSSTISDNGVLQAVVMLTPGSSIEYLQLSYVISTTALFKFEELTGLATTGDLNYYGTGCFIDKIPQKKTVSITNQRIRCLGSVCPSPYITPDQCTAAGGVILEELCVVCNSPLVLVNQQCACPNNGYVVNGACSPCWANSSPNKFFTGCDCNAGFYPGSAMTCLRGIAPDCQNGKFNVVSQKCQCPITGMVYTDKVGCGCPIDPKTMLDIDLQKCVPIVANICLNGTNSPANDGTCVCKPNFLIFIIAVGCVCPDNRQIFDPKTGKCVTIPCLNGTMISKNPLKCACTPSFLVFVTSVGCVCPLNTNLVYDPTKKRCVPVCLNGTIDLNNPRVCTCSNPLMLRFDMVLGCVCIHPLEFYDTVSKKCVISPCLNGTADPHNPGHCICQFPFLTYDPIHGCICVNVNAYFVAASNKCIVNCFNGTLNTLDGQTCHCTPSFLVFLAGVGCVCPLNQNLIFDKVQNKCVAACLNGTVNAVNPRICDCPRPQILVFIVEVGCVCQDSFHYYFDITKQTCLLRLCLNGTTLSVSPLICGCPYPFLLYSQTFGCICSKDGSSYFDPKTKKCIPICLNATISLIDPTTCYCQYVDTYFKPTVGCVCINPLFLFDKLLMKCVINCLNGTISNLVSSSSGSSTSVSRLLTTQTCTCTPNFLIFTVLVGCVCPGQNLIFNKLNNNCIPVCLNGTISTIDPRTCSCPFPALLIFKVGMGCICHNYQDNYYYDPRSQKCLLSPCLNGTMINGICACPSTTLRFDSLYGCVCIIPYALYNPETNLCVANCLNATADGNGNCICSPKAILMFKFSIGCVCIQKNHYFDVTTQSCILSLCQNGTVDPENPSNCLCPFTFLTYIQDKGCFCINVLFYYDDKSQKCLPISQCLNGTKSVSTGECICYFSFLKFNPQKGCICVNAITYFDVKLSICVRNCLNGTISKTDPLFCVCPSSLPLFFVETIGCICIDRSTYFDPKTQTCITSPCLNGTLNPITKACQCQYDFLTFDTVLGCICINVNTYFSPEMNQCLFKCLNATFSLVSTSNCYCKHPSTYFVPGFGCLCTNPGQFWNSAKQECVGVINCRNGTLNQEETGCNCPYSFLMFDPKDGCVCINVGTYFDVNTGSCIKNCFNGTLSKIHPLLCECPVLSLMVFVENLGCVCPNQGMIFNQISQKCQSILCNNGTLNPLSQTCECAYNFLKYDKVFGCVCVVATYIFVAAVQQCLPDCLNGTINYNTLQCSCSCLFLKFVPTVGCVCADSTQVYDPCTKSCVPIFKPVPCQNGYPNPNVPGSCICNFLFLVYVENQGCICPASMNNAIFNPALGFCVCIAANAYMLNNVCTSCWLFSKPNAQQTTCICLDGYVQAGNSCIQKQNCLNGTLNQQTGVCYCTITGTYFLATVGCVCKDPHAYFNFGVCVCIKGYYSYKGLCTQCWDNSIPADDKLSCVCILGFVAVGNTCVQETQSCLNGTLNQQTGVCYCEFVGMVFITNVGCQCRDQNAYFDVASKSCTCNTNYYLFKGACTICWKNSFPANDLTTCVCKTGFVAVGMTCVAQTINCLNGTYNSQTNTCTCTIVGMYFQATVGCLCQDPNSQYDIMANACTCLPNHYQHFGYCVRCWFGSIVSNDLSTCLCIEGYLQVGNTCVKQDQNCFNATLNPQTGVCYCPQIGMRFLTGTGCVCRDPFAVYSASLSMCGCIANYYQLRGACTKCWDNSYPSTDFMTCICIDGYIQLGNSCILPQRNCYNGTLNTVTGTCYCPIPITSYVSGIGCLCKDTNAYYSKQLADCICITNYYSYRGQCVPCWPNSIQSDDFTTCNCLPGYKPIGQTCVQPTQDCLNGTYSVKLSACTCSISILIFVLKVGCVCPNIQEYYSIELNKCVCNSQSYFLDKVCTKCWDKSSPIADQTFCGCDFGYTAFGNSCIQNRYCINGYFDPTLGVCTCSFGLIYQEKYGCVCASPNMYYDQIANQCFCNADSYFLDNVCTKCGDNAKPTEDKSGCRCVAGFTSDCMCHTCIAVSVCINGTFNSRTGQCQCPFSFLTYKVNLGCVCTSPNSYFSPETSSCVCNSNSYYYNSMCKECPENAIPLPDKSSCRCKPGYTKVGENCVSGQLCLNGYVHPVTGQCYCNSPILQYSYTVGCVCIDPNAIYDQNSATCFCNSKSYLVNKVCVQCWVFSEPSNDLTTCVCIQGYVKKGNSCVYGNNCLNGGTLDPYTGFCVCSLSILQYNENFGCACKDPNAYFDAASQTCQCTGNSVKIGGLCVQCWQFSVVSANGLTCACIKGYILNQQGNVCVSAGCTGTAMYNSATGQCQCGNGFTYSAVFGCVCNGQNQMLNIWTGRCSCNLQSFMSINGCKRCPDNSSPTPDSSQCACNAGYRMNAVGLCVSYSSCLPLSQWNSTLGVCVCIVQGMTYNSAGCSCPNNQIYNPNTNKCACDANSILYGATCVNCGANSFPAPTRSTCVCRTDYYPSPGGGCAQRLKCPPNSQFDTILGTCVCSIFGQTYANGMCSCPNNMVVSYILQRCMCNANQYLRNGICTPCWNNAMPSGNQLTCDCNSGYTSSGPQYCVEIQKCISPAYYNIIQGCCVCLISNQVYSDTAGCICQVNRIFNAMLNLCVCMPGYYQTGNQCKKCWDNSVVSLNGNWCTCVPGFVASTSISMTCVSVQGCINPAIFNSAQNMCVCQSVDQSYSNTQGCYCIAPNKVVVNGICRCNTQYYTVNDACVICWKNAVANSMSTSCDCQNGFYLAAPQTCIPFPNCPALATWTGSECRCTIFLMRMVNNACVCPDNMVLNANKIGCVCDSNSFFSIGGCTKCWDNAMPTNDGSTCKCKTNYVPGATPNTCVAIQTCIGGATYDYNLKKCQCPPDQTYNPVTGCQCTEENRVKVGGSCVCNSKSYFFQTRCIVCWDNSSPVNGQTNCACNPNYYSASVGVCVSIPTCPGLSKWNYNTNQCTCVSSDLTMGANGCHCPTNQVYSIALSICVCDAWSYPLQQVPTLVCQKCWQNSSPFERTCQCNPGFSQIPGQSACQQDNMCIPPAIFDTNSRSCACPPGYNYNSILGCVAMAINCLTNQKYDSSQGKCVCLFPNMVVNNLGCFCPGLMVLNSLKGICTYDQSSGSIVNSNCPINQAYQLSSASCVCDTMSFQKQASPLQCTQCGTNAKPFENSCQCDPGYVQSTQYNCVKDTQVCINTNGNGATWNTVLNACVCRMTFVYDTEKGCVCPANQNLGPMGSCVCQFGFYYKGDVCVKCGDNSYSSPDYRTCFCRDGFVKQGDNCVESQTCGNNQVYSVDLKKCVCNIPGMVIDNNNQCVCPDNQQFNSVLQKCNCNSKSYSVLDKCLPCWLHSTRSADGLTCDCDSGYAPQNQACVLKCTPPAIQSPDGRTCICTPGLNYSPTDGCVCPLPNMTPNQIGDCACDSFSYSVNNNCVRCWGNSKKTADGTSCTCIEHYYESSFQMCTQIPSCPEGAQWDYTAQTCDCIILNMVYSASGCKCPPGTALQGGYCKCTSNSYLVGTNCMPCWDKAEPTEDATDCTCIAGYYQAGYHTCTSSSDCPPGAYYNLNANTCVCNIPGQVLQKSGCQCPLNMFLTILGECICGYTPGSTPMCNCASNFQYVSGVGCSLCGAGGCKTNLIQGGGVTMTDNSNVFLGMCLDPSKHATDLNAASNEPGVSQISLFPTTNESCYVMKVSLNNDAKSAPSDKAFAVNVSYSSVDGNNNNVKMVETITRNTSSLTQSTKGALYSNAGDSGSLKLGGKGASGAQRLVIPVINATTDKVKIPGYDSRWDKTLFPNK